MTQKKKGRGRIRDPADFSWLRTPEAVRKPEEKPVSVSTSSPRSGESEQEPEHANFRLRSTVRWATRSGSVLNTCRKHAGAQSRETSRAPILSPAKADSHIISSPLLRRHDKKDRLAEQSSSIVTEKQTGSPWHAASSRCSVHQHPIIHPTTTTGTEKRKKMR